MSEAAAPRPLTAKQEAFCSQYIAKAFNGTEAAIAAGYAKGSAAVTASQLLRNPNIQARIAELQAPALLKLDITREAVLREVALIAFARLGDIIHVTDHGDPYLDFNLMTEAHKAALSEATLEDFVDRREVNVEGEVVARDVRRVKGKMADKMGALTFLGKHFGLVTEQVELTVSNDFAAQLEASRKRAAASRKPK